MNYAQLIAVLEPAVRNQIGDKRREGITRMTRANFIAVFHMPREVYGAAPSVVRRALDEAIGNVNSPFIR